eukprot:69598_1
MAQFDIEDDIKYNEDDCFNESIIADDGIDRRQKISISPNKLDDIIQCIGSVWVSYKVQKEIEHSLGTATVIAFNKYNNKCIALTAAHNFDSQIVRQCPLCHQKMIKSNCYCTKHPTKTIKTKEKVKPFRIQFQRRCIEESRSINGIHYTLGQVIQPYRVKLSDCNVPKQYSKHPFANRGHDICLLVFYCDDDDGI